MTKKIEIQRAILTSDKKIKIHSFFIRVGSMIKGPVNRGLFIVTSLDNESYIYTLSLNEKTESFFPITNFAPNSEDQIIKLFCF